MTDAMTPGRRAQRRRSLILAALADHGPMPASRIDQVTGWRTVLPELGPLEDAGLIASGNAQMPDGTWGRYYRLTDAAERRTVDDTTDNEGT